MMISHLLDGVLFSLIRLAMIGYKIHIDRAISEVEMDEGIPWELGIPQGVGSIAKSIDCNNARVCLAIE